MGMPGEWVCGGGEGGGDAMVTLHRDVRSGKAAPAAYGCGTTITRAFAKSELRSST